MLPGDPRNQMPNRRAAPTSEDESVAGRKASRKRSARYWARLSVDKRQRTDIGKESEA